MDTAIENNEQVEQASPRVDDDDEKNATSEQAAASAATAAQLASMANKIEILLKPVGSAPILKKKKFTLDRTKNVRWLIEWLKKYMKLDAKEQMFLYVNQEFAPSLDTEIGTIFDCFCISNTLIFHYCTTPAWG